MARIAMFLTALLVIECGVVASAETAAIFDVTHHNTLSLIVGHHIRKGRFSMKLRCFLFIASVIVIISTGCNQEKPKQTRQASKSSGLPVAPAKPGYQNVPSAQPAVPAPTTPKIDAPLTFKVNSVKTQNSYSQTFAGRQSNTQAKAGFTFLLVNVSVQNTTPGQESFSSPSFRILDAAGKRVDAMFMGFDNTICMSGSMAMNDWSSVSVSGDTIVRYKGTLDSNEPKNSRLEWELAPSKSYTATFMRE